MTHLLRLELRKMKLYKSLMCIAVLIIGCVLFITVSLVDSATDPAQSKDNFENTFKAAGLLLSFVFLVYSSLLTARLVIGEYNHKTIQLLFTYPMNRNMLIVSKLIIVMSITAAALALGYVCCCGYLYVADKYWDLLEGNFQPEYLYIWLQSAISSIVVCTALSLWPFIIGMIKKSVPATIVSSLFVIITRQLLITKNATNMETMVQIVLILLLTGVGTFFTFQKKVSEIE